MAPPPLRPRRLGAVTILTLGFPDRGHGRPIVAGFLSAKKTLWGGGLGPLREGGGVFSTLEGEGSAPVGGACDDKGGDLHDEARATIGRTAGPPQHRRLCAVLRQGQGPAASRYQRLDKHLGQAFGGSGGDRPILPVLFFLSRRESEISIPLPPLRRGAGIEKKSITPGAGKKTKKSQVWSHPSLPAEQGRTAPPRCPGGAPATQWRRG